VCNRCAVLFAPAQQQSKHPCGRKHARKPGNAEEALFRGKCALFASLLHDAGPFLTKHMCYSGTLLVSPALCVTRG